MMPQRMTKKLALLAATTLALALAAPLVAQDRPYRQDLITLTTADGHSLPALMTQPPGGINVNAPAIIHCQGGPGGSPLDGSGPWIAAGMAARGYTVVAPMIRHAERMFDTDFSDYDKDIAATVDYLTALGFHQIVLTGSSFGSITITRYMVDRQDPRISALIHFAPTEDTGPFTRRGMGEAEFHKQNDLAAAMVARGDLETIFGPAFVGPPPQPAGTSFAFYSTPKIWMDMWGQGYGAVNLALFPKLRVPILLLAGEKDGYNTMERLGALKAAATASPRVDILFYRGNVDHSFNSNPPVHPQIVQDVAGWLGSVGLAARPAVTTQVITSTDTEPGIRAIRYTPAATAPRPGLAFLLVHDFMGSALAGPPHWAGEAAAQAGYLAIAINSNRGSRGSLVATYAASDKDIGDWVDYLQRHGHDRVVLVGHGIGATRVAHYLATRRDRRVVGTALLAPAADSAAFLRGRIGAAAYDKAVAEATARGASDLYTDFVYLRHVPAGVPANIDGATAGEGDTLVMQPAAFLDSWGPKAPVLSRLVGTLPTPLFAAVADDDAGFDAADLARLKAAGGHATIRRFAGADHDFDGRQPAVGDAMMAWAAALDPAGAQPAPAAVRPAVAPVVPTAPLPQSPHGRKVGGTPETSG